MVDINELNNLSVPTDGEITEEQYRNIKVQTGFDVKLFNEILDLQNGLNEQIDPNWVNMGFDWNHAILLEASELLDSIDWKWWKKGKTDWANLEIEMVDLAHFIFSLTIQEKLSSPITSLIVSKEVQAKNTPKREMTEELAKDISDIIKKKLMQAVLFENTLSTMIAWLEAWYLMGYTINDLFAKYKMKYTLNIFRQNHGYKTGEYKKIWFGEEDNVHAQRLMTEIDDASNFIEELDAKLEDVYAMVPDVEEKSLENFIKTDEKWSQFMVLVPDDNRKVMFELAKEFQDYLEN